MAYIAREIKDRIAEGDDIFIFEKLNENTVKLTPAPTTIYERGTTIDKALLQPIEDRTVWLMNRFFDPITANKFRIEFDSLDGLVVEGHWDVTNKRITG